MATKPQILRFSLPFSSPPPGHIKPLFYHSISPNTDKEKAALVESVCRLDQSFDAQDAPKDHLIVRLTYFVHAQRNYLGMLSEADTENMRPFFYRHIDFGPSISDPRDLENLKFRLRWLYLCSRAPRLFQFISLKVNLQICAQVPINFLSFGQDIFNRF